MAKHIKRSKIIRSYDGLDREEKTGGLMAMRIFVVLVIIAFVSVGTALLVNNILKENDKLSEEDMQTDTYYRGYNAEDQEELIGYCGTGSPLSDYYIPDTSEYKDGIAVNTLMLDSLVHMVNAAQNDGLNIEIVRGYTDAKSCDIEFNRLKLELESSGATLAEAESSARAIFPPSQLNEYRTGMLIKISDMESDEFAKTELYRWMYKNGINYGFINRYTEEKQSVTGINEDLTVYRFVGTDNAEKMRSFGMCLEEYYDYCSYR